MPLLANLAGWSAALRYDQIPEETLRAARFQVLNMVAAVHASAELPEVGAVRGAVAASLGTGRSTLLATGEKTSALGAAFANAACSMAQDFDDIIWMGHTCHSAVFAALAVAEHEGRDANEFLTAVVAANEIGGRIGASCFLGPINGQMQTFIHSIGAAAATARLLGLDAEKTAHALAISLAQPCYALQPAFFRPTSKLLAAATPLQIGIQAAYLARGGMTGALELLEDPRGFWKVYSFIPLPAMIEGLGEFWALQTLTLKSYPLCHYFQTACSAIDEIRARNPAVSREKIRAVRIDTTKLGIEVAQFAREYGSQDGHLDPVNSCFDVASAAAIQLFAGKLTGAEIEPAWLSRNEKPILALREKVHVAHDPALTAKVLGSARAVPSGRKSLPVLFNPRNLLLIRRRFAEEYRSKAVRSPEEILGWLRVMTNPPWKGEEETGAVSAVPLYFPNRVRIELEDGSVETLQHDLPTGAFCHPRSEQTLREKVLREGGRFAGDARAAALFDAGMRLGQAPLADFVARAAGPGQA